MCGIAGYFNGRPNKERLMSMVSQLEHRGPDGFGYYIDEQAGLAHARLSIIDIEGGAQPMSNEDGTVWVTFNGEIYNYIELRTVLESQGHVFRTKSDTEVIVHAYEEYGDDCAAIFNGQFAFAIWDTKIKRGFMARDRVGIQPLFFAWDDDETLYFGSEVKSLLSHPGLRNGLSKRELANVFTYWAPSKGRTVFIGIFEVEPGQIITFGPGYRRDYKRYWDHNYTKKEQSFDLGYHMDNSIDFRLRADVPVGAYLSGGLDSSIIASMTNLRKRTDNSDLRTFSIAFDDEQYDESEYQKKMVFNLIGNGYSGENNHTTFKCTQEDISHVFPDVVYHAEKPLFRTAPAPMYLLSRHVKEAGYKVVLTGEGADEVFAGYDIFRENYVRREMVAKKHDTAYINKLLHDLYPWMSDKMLTSSTDYLKVFFGGGSGNTKTPWFSHEMRIASSSKSHKFFSEGMYPYAPYEYFDEYSRSLLSRNPSDPLETAQYLEFKTLFNGYLMSSQGDRMLMAHGVEGRFPFLDPNVVDYGNALDPQEKLKVEHAQMQEKWILKRLGAKLGLPISILDRKKQPYMAPDGVCFLKGDNTPAYVVHALETDYGFFNMKKVAILRKKMEAGKVTGFAENMAFMGILSTQLLHWLMVEDDLTVPTVPEGRFNVREERFSK